MAINLLEKASRTISTYFTTESLVAGRLSTEYDWSGVKTVKIMTPQTVPMVDYTRSGANRYGTPTEMEDVIQEMTLTQDKSLCTDGGQGQQRRSAGPQGRRPDAQIAACRARRADDGPLCWTPLPTRRAPLWAAAPRFQSNVCERISAGTEALDDAEVPQSGRTLFLPAAVYNHAQTLAGVSGP